MDHIDLLLVLLLFLLLLLCLLLLLLIVAFHLSNSELIPVCDWLHKSLNLLVIPTSVIPNWKTHQVTVSESKEKDLHHGKVSVRCLFMCGRISTNGFSYMKNTDRLLSLYMTSTKCDEEEEEEED